MADVSMLDALDRLDSFSVASPPSELGACARLSTPSTSAFAVLSALSHREIILLHAQSA
jgi:hypothetical protein